MAIVGVSSGGYNAVYAANTDKKDTPTSLPLTRGDMPNLAGVSLKGTALTETVLEYDRRYDSFEQGEKPLLPDKLIHTPLPRNIGWDLMTSFNDNLERTMDLAEIMNLSYGENELFFNQEGRKWVENIKQKDPEMFVEWVRSNKKFIEEGKPHLARLPSNFTMSDYYSYVKDE